MAILTAAPFLAYAAFHFDSDQAIFGLMGIDIAHAHAFPLAMYGQDYLLPVPSWLAAPGMALFGASLTALKAPLLAVHALTVWMLYRLLRSQSGLGPWPAALATAPIAVPVPAMAAAFSNVSLGAIESLCYVVAIYALRARPIALALLVAVASAHREFVVAGVMALALVELFDAGTAGWLRFAKRWLTIAVVAVAATTAIRAAQARTITNGVQHHVTIVANRHPLQSLPWLATHAATVLGLHTDGNVSVGVAVGYSDPAVWLRIAALAVLVVLACATLVRTRVRPETAFARYLVMTGVFAAVLFVAVPLDPDLMQYRYLPLVCLLPSGLAAATIGSSGDGYRRRLAVSAAIILAAANAISLVTYSRALARAHLVDTVREVAVFLEQRNLHYGSAPYWTAYNLTFRSGGTIHVASSDVVRILSYQDEYRAHRAEAFRLGEEDCAPDREVSVRAVRVCVPAEKAVPDSPNAGRVAR